MVGASADHPEPWSASVRVRRTHDKMGNGPVAMPEEVLVRVSVGVVNRRGEGGAGGQPAAPELRGFDAGV